MKGDCVSDFRDGHGEQGFDIKTGRSGAPVRVHISEPIYDIALRQLGFTRTIAAWLDVKGWHIYALPTNDGQFRGFEVRNYRKTTSGYLSAQWVRKNDVPTYVGDGADTLLSDVKSYDPNCNKTAHRAACDGHECEEPHLHHDDHDTNDHFASTINPPPLRGYTSAERKAAPVWSILAKYFPDALFAVARHSKKANDKHNPGEPLHWAREKSNDHLECAVRHLATPFELDLETGEIELVGATWRCLAELQLYEEKRLRADGIKPLSGQ